MAYKVSKIPYEGEIAVETTAIFRKLAVTHRYLAELKGTALSIPNQGILIDTLSVQESKDSSEIENIITTHDDLFQDDAKQLIEESLPPAIKEVRNYVKALKRGFSLISERGLLTSREIVQIQELLEANKAGFRKLPGTELKNARTGEIVYTPPQNYDEIVDLMSNLEKFINDESLMDYDPLIKMAIMHFQFESIHPFYDGNGRTGRIMNILYLVNKGLLDIPVLYLSRYFIVNKNEYYHRLQGVRDRGEWEAWILFILDAIEQTAKRTLETVKDIKGIMDTIKDLVRVKTPKLYTQDLINNMFRHPYTKIEFIQEDLKVTRQTAARYLESLVKAGVLKKKKVGRTCYYMNFRLKHIFEKIEEYDMVNRM